VTSGIRRIDRAVARLTSRLMGGRRRRRTSESDEHERERAAIVSLALAQLEPDQEARLREMWAGEGIPDLATALDDLADLTEDRKRISQRTFSLQLLAKVAMNRGTGQLLPAMDSLRRLTVAVAEEDRHLAEVRAERERAAEAKKAAAAEQMLEMAEVELAMSDAPTILAMTDGPDAAAGPATGPPLSDPDDQVQGVFDGLNNAAFSGMEVQSAWEAFTQTQRTLTFTEDELNLPQCTDDKMVDINGHESYRVVTWFTSPKPAADFADWTDPRQWHLDCNLFYQSVTPKSPTAISANEQDFSTTFVEVVRFTPTKTLTTDLVFTRTYQPPNLFAVHFSLADPNGTADILVDSGSLVARHDPDLPAERATRITAEKCIAFTDPAMALWPTLCCDLFWTELTITVALGCAQDGY
jgi:hypothetical protein